MRRLDVDNAKDRAFRAGVPEHEVGIRAIDLKLVRQTQFSAERGSLFKAELCCNLLLGLAAQEGDRFCLPQSILVGTRC